MQKAMFAKALIAAILAAAIMIPLSMIGSIVSERQNREGQVISDVAATYAGRQRLIGPVLALPYVEEYTVPADRDTAAHTVREDRVALVYPERTTMDGQMAADFKRRGLFKALVYELSTDLTGEFRVPEAPAVARHAGGRLIWGIPVLALGLDDPRGLMGRPDLTMDGVEASFEQGTGAAGTGPGLHALVDASRGQVHHFALKLRLRGTQQLAIVPVAGSTQIKLGGNWPHPHFDGRFLPDPATQRITDAAFSAQWDIPALASRARQQLVEAQAAHPTCPAPACLDAVEIKLVEPVNIYSLSDRALKYGFLFVWLTFAGFFVFETLSKLRIHPLQYSLVGLALAMFFLLLLSISEHLDFAVAYALAAAASASLITFYLAYVLRSGRRALAAGGLLTGLYGALYVLLVSEDHALLLGALLLFALLALTMVATRRVDWYGDRPDGTMRQDFANLQKGAV